MEKVPLDSKAYAASKRRVNKIYGTTSSAYRSMAIVRDYKRHGGKYTGDRPSVRNRPSGVTKWLREQWIVVSDFLRGKVTPCGSTKRRSHACRPSTRVDSTTPVTIQEVLDVHGVRKTKDLASAKRTGSERVRIDWKKGRTRRVDPNPRKPKSAN